VADLGAVPDAGGQRGRAPRALRSPRQRLAAGHLSDDALRQDMTRDIVIDALRMAWFRRHPSKDGGLIFHSDRGSQYASKDFRDVLTEYGLTASMSRRGSCRDNTCSEILFGSLKVERLHGQRLKTRRQAMDEVVAWLLWCNRVQLHSTLACVSPLQFEENWLADQPRQASAQSSHGTRNPGARSVSGKINGSTSGGPQQCPPRDPVHEAPSAPLQASALNDPNQNHNDRDDQEDVNEPAHRVRGDKPQKPKYDEDDGDGLEHGVGPYRKRDQNALPGDAISAGQQASARRSDTALSAIMDGWQSRS
jgi:hypothetical protein